MTTGNSASTGVYMQANDDKLIVAAPTAINMIVKADGTLVGPSTDSTYLENGSVFGIHVKNIKTTALNDFALEGEGGASNDSINLNITPNGGAGINAASCLGGLDMFNDYWNMSKAGTDGAKLGLATGGDTANITKDLAANQQFAQIDWTFAPGTPDYSLKGNIALDNNAPVVGDTITATASDLNVSADKVSYQWYRSKDNQETAINGATGLTYTTTADDQDYQLVCKASTSDEAYHGVIVSPFTKAVSAKIEAFAVYSADDQSLNFYKRAVPNQGSQFEGKTATRVFTGIETATYNVNSLPWKGYISGISSTLHSATIVDDGISPVSTACWFYTYFSNYSLITVNGLSKLDTSNVTDMSKMFYGNSALTTLDLSNWDTSNVTDMSGMFTNCYKLTTLDLSNWNTSKVTNMGEMFYYCSALTTLGDLSNWNTSKVTNMGDMFYYCSDLTTLGDLSNWNTSKVKNMNSLFNHCYELTSFGAISNWDTSNVTDMGHMFDHCSKLTTLDLSNWNTSKVTNMGEMFYCCSALTTLGDLSNWDTSNVTNMEATFQECSSLTLDCSNWNVSEVTDHEDFNWGATDVVFPLAWQDV